MSRTKPVAVASVVEPQSGEGRVVGRLMTTETVVAPIAEPQSGEVQVVGVGPHDN
jgi:hypothetical protein